MTRIETRVTSVQVVQGFPACLTIPNPPGWDVFSSSCSAPPSSLDASVESCRQPVGDPEGNVHAIPPPSTPDPIRPSDIPLRRMCTTHEVSPIPADAATHLPLGTLSEGPISYEKSASPSSLYAPSSVHTVKRSHRPDQFNNRKVSGEDVFVNYMIGRGGWLEAPPTPLNFGSCKEGPIFYVNEVTDRKVSQIWNWDATLGQWTSVMEGAVFHTARERQLELDKNRIPRLRAVRKRQGLSASKL